MFSLSWEDYKPHIFQGLGALQQNGELVDMTLAADGHLVKVHRLLISLASPYLKELLNSANCSHPIIFLNRVSYETLCCILEYVYTGQATVSRDRLPELVQAAKELQIKGLEDMTVKMILQPNQLATENRNKKDMTHHRILDAGRISSDTGNNVVRDESSCEETNEMENPTESEKTLHMLDGTVSASDDIEQDMDHGDYDDAETEQNEMDNAIAGYSKENYQTPKKGQPIVQYTVSAQGALQLVINRFIYFLRYTSRKGTGGAGHRHWRCVNYFKLRCQAHVVTKDDLVVSRKGSHNHPFHDKQILKRVQSNRVFSSVGDAEILGSTKRKKT